MLKYRYRYITVVTIDICLQSIITNKSKGLYQINIKLHFSVILFSGPFVLKENGCILWMRKFYSRKLIL